MKLLHALALLFLAAGHASAQAPGLSLEDRFRADLRAFAYDLERTGRADAERARQIAYHAVSEAYRYNISPALVFGVMMVENSTLRSDAVSSAGALGLMQIMPLWISSQGRRLGRDLTDDATNVRYGTFILRHYIDKNKGDLWRALLNYNGCVRGTNTPTCFSYPDLVRRQVEQGGRTICPTGSAPGCLVRRPRSQLASGP
jgi:soluble lytic murein transglycosylase-like protein